MIRALHRLTPSLCALLVAVGCVEETEAPVLDDRAVALDAHVDRGAADPDASVPDARPDQAPTPGCGNEDDLFPNQRPEQAAPIAVGFARADLFLCPDTEDYFRLELGAGESVTLSLRADPLETDLDLAVLDAAGALLAESAGEIGDETLRFQAPAAGSYLVRINGYRGEAAPYLLSVLGGCVLDAQCPAGQICQRSEATCAPFVVPDCGADRHEPNDRDDQAAPLAVPGEATGTVCVGDRDWFAFEAAAGDTVDVLLSFRAGADLDLAVIDLGDGAILDLAQGDARTNPERLNLTSLPAGRYGVVVLPGQTAGAQDVEYTLQIAGRSQGCTIDRDCANPTRPVCAAGTCGPVQGPGPAPLGGRCGQPTDCGPDADLCYTGGPGGHDNFCTIECQADAACAGLGAGATCVPVTRRTAFCFPPCAEDTDCSLFRRCDGGECALRGACSGDAQCGPGEVCEFTAQGSYCALVGPPPHCGADHAQWADNDRADRAPWVPTDGTPIEGLALCNADRDHFRFEISPDQAAYSLEVAVTSRAGVDLDVYVTDANGALVAAGTSPDQNPEIARARYLAPGTYTVRVVQFSSDRLEDTAYTLSVLLVDNGDACTLEGNECGATEPLRLQCLPEIGACQALDGRGAVPLGGSCDSDDDCVPEALLCWLFEGGTLGVNVCTVPCQGPADCAAAPGTECTPFQGGFAVCLPPRG